MAERHFFSEAPSLSWLTWFSRILCYNKSSEPSCIQSSLFQKPVPRAKTGTLPTLARTEHASEYSEFLEKYFYDKNAPIALCVPASLIKRAMEESHLVGVELRDCDRKLVGCVFDFYAGIYKEKSVGLVSWMCVHPAWRGKGIGSCLLFSLYAHSFPREIHLWRNDGWMRSPIPPLLNEARICRKKQPNRTGLMGARSVQLQKASFSKWESLYIDQWKQKYPHGLLFNDSHLEHRFVEVWEARLSANCSAALLVQPTFEKKRNTNERYCEIVFWAFEGQTKSEYEQAHFLESMIDQLPYDYVESSQNIPHFEQGWQTSAQICWSCIGLDPGCPATRQVVSFCSV